MKTEISDWEKECNQFYDWFKALGGNIASPEQMDEAFKRIEAKNVSDSRLYEMLDNPKNEWISPIQKFKVKGNN